MVVRHPFDRVLSAYRDRIMNKGTGQAVNHIPRIYVALKVRYLKLCHLFSKILNLKINHKIKKWFQYIENPSLK